MGKKKTGRSGSRFFRWIRSDLPDEEEGKTTVLLLGVTRISDSPSSSRRFSSERSQCQNTSTFSNRLSGVPKQGSNRNTLCNERLEKIRNDLLSHKHCGTETFQSNSIGLVLPSNDVNHDILENKERRTRCFILNCVGTCKSCKTERNQSISNRGSFLFQRPEVIQPSLYSSEVYVSDDSSANLDTSHSAIKGSRAERLDRGVKNATFQHAIPQAKTETQPIPPTLREHTLTPKSNERRFFLSHLNERFRKTLSLDSRKIDTNRTPPSNNAQSSRPKSMINAFSLTPKSCRSNNLLVNIESQKAKEVAPKKKRFRPKSFFSLETFFDSRKSDSSSVDDYSSSKYKKFELEGDDSPLFREKSDASETARVGREKTPDLLDLPFISATTRRKKDSNPKRQLEKLENHFNRIQHNKIYDNIVPYDVLNIRDLTEQGTSSCRPCRPSTQDDDEVEYIEPIRSNFTSQSTLILDNKFNSPYCNRSYLVKPDSVLSINTEDTDLRLPSSTDYTVSPRSARDLRVLEIQDIDSIGAFEIEVKEGDVFINPDRQLTVKLMMDKSIDSIGSCSLDVDASTDFSDTTSGSLNLLTPSSPTSRIKDFTSRIQERAASANLQANSRLQLQASLNPSAVSQTGTEQNRRSPFTQHEDHKECLELPKHTEHKRSNPKLVVSDATNQRSSRNHKKVHPDSPQKKPSYLNLACSVNGYSNLTTYDSKLRQNINKSREASPIRPITHTYRQEYSSNLLVPVPVSADKLIVSGFGTHETRGEQFLTTNAPEKAQNHYLATSPILVYMAAEHKQLKTEFLSKDASPNDMTTAKPYVSNEARRFVTSTFDEKSNDEVDDARISKTKDFKTSYSETCIDLRKSNTYSSVSINGQSKSSETKLVSSTESYTIRQQTNGSTKRVDITRDDGEQLTSPLKSFIQQRVERLYGPGALAQGFFNQKRQQVKSRGTIESDFNVLTEKSLNCQSNNKQHISVTRFSHSFKTDGSEQNIENVYECVTSPNGSNHGLPVLRHLRPEFRAQLPILSPKKTNANKSLNVTLSPASDRISTKFNSTVQETTSQVPSHINILKSETSLPSHSHDSAADSKTVIIDVKSDKVMPKSPVKKDVEELTSDFVTVVTVSDPVLTSNGENTEAVVVNGDIAEEPILDGHYFLTLKKRETDRLIEMSLSAERDLEKLQSQEEPVSEEVLGFLRSAAGKARLLATQKMQQFEGLCYNNLNRKEEEQFPTTAQDLRGFWDMVCLQVNHVDTLYEQLEQLRQNNWKELPSPEKKSSPTNGSSAKPVRARRSEQSNLQNSSEKSRLAAAKREADRKAMLEARRKMAREKILAAKTVAPSGGAAESAPAEEVEIFIGKNVPTATNGHR